MADGQKNSTADETLAYGSRLRDLEAQAFRTGRTLAEHSGRLRTMPERPPSAPGNVNSPGHATGGPGEDTVAARLDTMEQRLGSIERVLLALARAKGVDPETTG